MEIDEHVETDDTPKSLLDIIKQEVTDLGNNKEVYIPIQGHEKSGLAAKYRMPDGGKELDAIARKVEREVKDRWTRSINIAIDTMVTLCDGLYVKPEGVEDYVELDPQDMGVPVRFDDRMAEIIGLDSNVTSRRVIRKLFGDNELAIVNHTEKLNRWLMDTSADLETEVWQMGG